MEQNVCPINEKQRVRPFEADDLLFDSLNAGRYPRSVNGARLKQEI